MSKADRFLLYIYKTIVNSQIFETYTLYLKKLLLTLKFLARLS